MKRIKYLIHFVVLLLMNSCGNVIESEGTIIDIDKAKDGNFADYFDLHEIIPLGILEGFEIGTIDKVIYENNNIIILDKKGKKILIFDSNGIPLIRIKHNGKGKGEFLNPSDIALVDNNINISCRTSRKIIVYDLDGNFLHEEKTLAPVEKITILDSVKFYYAGYSGNMHKNKYYNLTVKREQETLHFLEFSKHQVGYVYSYNNSSSSFQHLDGNILFCETFNHNIYLLYPDDLIVKYRIVSSGFLDNNVFLENWTDQLKLSNLLTKEKAGFGCFFSKMNKNILFFVLRNNDGYSYSAYYYNDKDDELYKSKLLDRKNWISINILNSNDNKLIGYYNPSMLINIEFKEDHILRNYVDNLSANDNPLLFVYKFK